MVPTWAIPGLLLLNIHLKAQNENSTVKIFKIYTLIGKYKPEIGDKSAKKTQSCKF